GQRQQVRGCRRLDDSFVLGGCPVHVSFTTGGEGDGESEGGADDGSSTERRSGHAYLVMGVGGEGRRQTACCTGNSLIQRVDIRTVWGKDTRRFQRRRRASTASAKS